MSEFIVLTADEIAKMRANAAEPYGERGWMTGPNTAMEPVPLKDGTFILPIEVLADPAHAATLEAFKVDVTVAVDLTKAQTRDLTLAEVADAVAVDVVEAEPFDVKG